MSPNSWDSGHSQQSTEGTEEGDTAETDPTQPGGIRRGFLEAGWGGGH